MMRSIDITITGRTFATIAAAIALAASAGAVASDGKQEDSAGRKAARGLAAMTTGFLEVPGNIAAETRRNGAASGFTLGFVKGLGGIVVRELVGVYEFVTSPLEMPAGYRPLIQPEFPWDYFDESRRIADDRNPRTVSQAGGPL